MATREAAQRARNAKLDALEERIMRSVEELVSGDDWRRAMEFAARFRSRSFNNTLLIWAQHLEAYEQGRVPTPTPMWVAGFNDWKKLGRWAEAGGGYEIRSPVRVRFATTTPKDPASWRRLPKGERPRPGEVVQRRIVSVVPAHVWDVSRTHGADLPELPSPKLLTGQAPEGLWDGLASQTESLGYEVLRMPVESISRGANGSTDFETRQVLVRADMDPAAQVKTLAHELGHVRMHGPNQQEARLHRGIGEVEAESVALMVGAAHGMDTSDYTIPYVAGWAANVDGKDPIQVIRDTGERVRRTAAHVLDQLDTIQVGNGNPVSLRVADLERSAPEEAPARSPQITHLPDREPQVARTQDGRAL
ncbi:ImmA/IrrE family metallo-endopeptidase [Paramicrobacterium chengjingii]|uniref:ImmA/IrrE family metallo-endopeptidase n=1 Tax=Paramicrobacterium chengjingii TaxID=2769067 RepID=UPI00141E77C9|nr:ImmA/IrrE family metallo-endopeptidase [Microbacterium chengjingii]